MSSFPHRVCSSLMLEELETGPSYPDITRILLSLSCRVFLLIRLRRVKSCECGMARIWRALLSMTTEDGSAVMFLLSTSDKSWQAFSYKFQADFLKWFMYFSLSRCNNFKRVELFLMTFSIWDIDFLIKSLGGKVKTQTGNLESCIATVFELVIIWKYSVVHHKVDKEMIFFC